MNSNSNTSCQATKLIMAAFLYQEKFKPNFKMIITRIFRDKGQMISKGSITVIINNTILLLKKKTSQAKKVSSE